MDGYREYPMPSSSANLCRGHDEFVSRSDVRNIFAKVLSKALYKLDDRLIDVDEQTVIKSVETCYVDHIIAAAKERLRSALNILLLGITKNASGI